MGLLPPAVFFYSPTIVDLARVSELLFFRRCALKRSRLRIRAINGESVDIFGRVIPASIRTRIIGKVIGERC